MIARRYEELFAWQLGDKFKQEVFRIVQSSPEAERNFKYRDQILEAASGVPKDIAEGFVRKSPGYMVQFLDFALGSLAEAQERLKDGIQLSYFPASDCSLAFRYAMRCQQASLRLKQSQLRYIEEERRRKRRRKPPRKKKDGGDQAPRT